MDIEKAKLLVQIISSLLVLGGILYAARQFKLATRVHQENHDWNRRNAAQQATIDYASKIPGSEELDNALQYMVAKEPIAIATIDNEFAKNKSLRAITLRVLNYHESLAVGVLDGVYDEKVIKSIRRSALERIFIAFKNFIDKVRTDIQPTAWAEQERLINKWKLEDNPPTFRKQTGGRTW
jgi:Domain of unknown function (DUF4760)